MRERQVWVISLIAGALMVLVAEGAPASKVRGLVILAAGAVVAELITRVAMAKAARMREGR
jgi:hypothetical protein